MTQQTWADLRPDPGMIGALDEADARIPRAEAVLRDREPRHKWSNAFADACARMIARSVRANSAFKKLHVLPDDEGNAEPPTYVVGDKSKRVDVVASSMISGLQVGISLKGMNFRDAGGRQFDKNLTNRTYELQDEVRLVHEYQPAAFMTAIFFLPIAATVDKKSETSASSFARSVEHMRARTGRLDASLPGHYARADMCFVALYVPGDREPDHDYEDTLARGVVRYFDVMSDPPKRGRPRLETTMDLSRLVDRIALDYRGGGVAPVSWADPE